VGGGFAHFLFVAYEIEIIINYYVVSIRLLPAVEKWRQVHVPYADCFSVACWGIVIQDGFIGYRRQS